MNRGGCVYILGSNSLVLYVGVTSQLEKRIWEHKQKLVPGFTQKYNVTRLLYYEYCDEIESAIEREKQIKKWRRVKKLRLIEKNNPYYLDLSEAWE